MTGVMSKASMEAIRTTAQVCDDAWDKSVVLDLIAHADAMDEMVRWLLAQAAEDVAQLRRELDAATGHGETLQ